MIIAHAVLEILDLRNSQYIYSDSELDFTKDLTNEYVTKIIEKIKKNASKREGEFRETSELRKTLQTFSQDTNFTEFAKLVSKQFVEALKKSETYISSDLLVVEYRENNEDNLAFIFLDNEQAITHIMYQNEGKTNNQITKSLDLLPQSSLKINTFMIVSLPSLKFYSVEKLRKIDGVKHKVLEENVVDATFKPSTNDIYKAVKNAVVKLSEADGLDKTEAIVNAKEHFNRHMDEEYLDIVSLADDVFKNDSVKKEFIDDLKKKGINETEPLEYELVSNKTKNSKIKTDTGIELTIPNDYFLNKDNIEIKDNDDGTMTIEIKNFTRIISR